MTDNAMDQVVGKIVSVNVGLPRTVEWRGKSVSTGIFKEPVEGPVMVRALNLDGDRQADLSVHGGPWKAVYGYASEHYPYWRDTLKRDDISPGAFGENLTTAGLSEDTLYIGDRLQVGSAELIVVQPRTPCYKLGIRFGRADMTKLFHRSGFSGYYFMVVTEGLVAAGDPIVLRERIANSLHIADLNHLFVDTKFEGAEGMLRRAVDLPNLPDGWRGWAMEQLAATR